MHPPRFYGPKLTVGTVALDEEQSRHALRSLRLRSGDALELFDGAGRVAVGPLMPNSDLGSAVEGGRLARGPRTATITVDRIRETPPQARRLTLLIAGCKGPRLTWMIEKCTELGVTRICLCDFARSVVKVGESHVSKLRRTAIEACKQCGRNWLPAIEANHKLASFLGDRPAETLLVASPAEETLSLGGWLAGSGGRLATLTVVIGPEGGLRDDELQALADDGAQSVHLAEHTLRVETAAVAMVAAWAAL
ncbi:MAG: 16S rRNA (uracil(1498)-N(3))-methyltransferase [Planctomycetes bacterium]|nr:16S rRNA (uracil(1498)-N(3))-methyltransferase [Planctomycetota bacterium]